MIATGTTDLSVVLSTLEPGLASVLSAIADSVASIADTLRSVDFDHAGSVNSFGDVQLQADLHADDVIFKQLRACSAVASASSEEQTDIMPLSAGGEYSVAFDPLDGSSIVDANFAVGSIFGVWRGPTPLGQTGRQQVAAAYSVYGPKTLLVIATRSPHTCPAGPDGSSSDASTQSAAAGGEGAVAIDTPRQQQQQQEEDVDLWDSHEVQQFSLQQGRWVLREAHVQIRARSIVAPANLKAAGENAAYKQLIDSWIAGGYKLRYSGGMVPDVHHILAKGGGVFCNPISQSAPAKLRLLYECAPLAFVMEAAGGLSSNGHQSILDVPISCSSMTSQIALGSRQQVQACMAALAAGITSASSASTSSSGGVHLPQEQQQQQAASAGRGLAAVAAAQ